jgi:hypothetical protein
LSSRSEVNAPSNSTVDSSWPVDISNWQKPVRSHQISLDFSSLCFDLIADFSNLLEKEEFLIAYEATI